MGFRLGFLSLGTRGSRTLEGHELLVSQDLSLISFQGIPPPPNPIP